MRSIEVFWFPMNSNDFWLQAAFGTFRTSGTHPALSLRAPQLVIVQTWLLECGTSTATWFQFVQILCFMHFWSFKSEPSIDYEKCDLTHVRGQMLWKDSRCSLAWLSVWSRTLVSPAGGKQPIKRTLPCTVAFTFLFTFTFTFTFIYLYICPVEFP